MNLNKLAFVDVETTGMRVNWDRIIEIGILRVEDGEIVSSFQSLVNPESQIPPEITALIGITYQDLEQAPSFRQIEDRVFELLRDSVFVAHNARFDYAFVKNEFKRLDRSFITKPLCSVKLSRRLFPRFKHHNLDSLISRFNLQCPNRHRALDDARVIFDFYRQITTNLKSEKIELVIKDLLKKPSLPEGISKEVIDSLPEAPGVYIFYGQKGAPLYVGKSVNIKDRVCSHFNLDHSSGSEMKISQAIESIEYKRTCGELGALLLESSLIKKIQPLYNRKLRNSTDLVAVVSDLNDDGYQIIRLSRLSEIERTELPTVMGVFKSLKAAKTHLRDLAEEHHLCQKLLALESTKSGCFASSLGRCYGACLKKEATLKYNLRFWEAFATSKLKRWPFKGSVAIKEVDSLEDKEDTFIVNEWCILESSIKGVEGISEFDIDAYRILNRHLLHNGNQRYIKELSSNLF